MKVYITGSSFRSLTNNSKILISIDQIKEILSKEIVIPRLFYMFSKQNLEYLYKNLVFLTNSDEIVKSLKYHYVKDRIDDLSYIIKIEGKLKYHTDNNCRFLLQGFKNFIIPMPISIFENKNKVLHLKFVAEIRDWFIKNNYIIEKYLYEEINDSILTSKFNNDFVPYINDKYFNGINENMSKIIISDKKDNQFKWYKEKNSGEESISRSFDINEYSKNVLYLLDKRKILCKNQDEYFILSYYDYLYKKTDRELADIIADLIFYGHLPIIDSKFINEHGGWSNFAKIKAFLREHSEIRIRIINLTVEYLKFKYNMNEIKLDKITLEDFNFECCSECKYS